MIDSSLARFALLLLGGYGDAALILTGTAHPFASAIIVGRPGEIITLVFTLAMVAATIDALASARDADLAPVRWLVGMWLIADAFAIAPAIQAMTGGTSLKTHYGDFVNAAQVLFLAFGVAYPILRHRLVDLNILVSRATVFAVVSAIIVGVFVAAEWGIAVDGAATKKLRAKQSDEVGVFGSLIW